MTEFEAVIETIDKEEFKAKIGEESQFEKYAKNKRRTSVDLGMVAVAYIRYCRQSIFTSAELKRYLLKFIELEELMDRYYSRSHFNVDVECKISRYINSHREEIVVFTDWIENMIAEKSNNTMFSY
jgi:hypothetical protein